MPSFRFPPGWKTILILNFMLAGLIFAKNPEKEQTWPNWRGVNYDGTVAGGEMLEGRMGISLKLMWKQKLGSGYSAVSVAGGRAVTQFAGSAADSAAAFDAETGRVLWRVRIDSAYKGHDGSHNGPISTPVVTESRVFGLSPWGKLFALDAATGRELWAVHLQTQAGAEKPWYGFSTSPLFYGNALIVETNGRSDNAIAAFNPQNGEVLWTFGSDTIQYQSPMLATVDQQVQLIAPADKFLYGLNPATGEMLWEYDFGGDKSPIGSACLNVVPAGEDRFYLKHSANESKLIKRISGNDITRFEEVWKERSIRRTYSTPVYSEGYLYGFSSGFLTCVEAATGRDVWKSRQPGDGFLILVDGHLVIMTKKGALHIAKADPAGYREVTGLPVFADHSWSAPSFSYGKFYMRSMGEIACVALAEEPAPAPVAAEMPALPPGNSEFGQFLQSLARADNKNGQIEQFIAGRPAFPIIEGTQTVHFVYRGEVQDVGISSDLFGARHVEPMIRVPGTDFYYLSATADPAALFNYHLVINFDSITVDPLNPRQHATFQGERSWFAMPGWKAPAHLNPADSLRRGRRDTLRLESAVTATTRRLDVYLPRGYDAGQNRYPVAYVHWGKMAQDPGQMPNSLDNLIGQGVAPVIVVFIPQTQGRHGEFSGERKEEYAQMLATEIVPLIDRIYRTIPAPEGRANLGMGFAGYAAIYTTFKHPGIFGKISAQSVFMLTYQENDLKAVIEAAPQPNLAIYLDWAKYDYRTTVEAWDMGVTNRNLAAFLRAQGYEIFGGETPESFGWHSWRNRTDRIFAALFPEN